MPGMSGPEFYEELAKKFPGMTSRVVFVTGDTVSQRTSDFLDWARRPVIEKPFGVAALETLVAEQLARLSSAEAQVPAQVESIADPTSGSTPINRG